MNRGQTFDAGSRNAHPSKTATDAAASVAVLETILELDMECFRKEAKRREQERRRIDVKRTRRSPETVPRPIPAI